jgi:hypothetical protein
MTLLVGALLYQPHPWPLAVGEYNDPAASLFE